MNVGAMINAPTAYETIGRGNGAPAEGEQLGETEEGADRSWSLYMYLFERRAVERGRAK